MKVVKIQEYTEALDTELAPYKNMCVEGALIVVQDDDMPELVLVLNKLDLAYTVITELWA